MIVNPESINNEPEIVGLIFINLDLLDKNLADQRIQSVSQNEQVIRKESQQKSIVAFLAIEIHDSNFVKYI
jgi:hypothetical protein